MLVVLRSKGRESPLLITGARLFRPRAVGAASRSARSVSTASTAIPVADAVSVVDRHVARTVDCCIAAPDRPEVRRTRHRRPHEMGRNWRAVDVTMLPTPASPARGNRRVIVGCPPKTAAPH
jgi:hypothetical protein